MHEVKKLSFPLSLSDLPICGAGHDIWQTHLDIWRRSGLSQREYCRRHNLSYDRFRKWKERLSNYPSGTSIKLVEVKNTPHDFTLQDNSTSFHSDSYTGYTAGRGPHGVRNQSGIGFWYGEFYIEVDENFSPGCLSQLLDVLHHSNWRNSSVKGSGCGG